MNRTSLVHEKDLKDWSGFTRKKDLVQFLINNGIAFFYGKDGSVVTTQAAIDSRLTHEGSLNSSTAIDFD